MSLKNSVVAEPITESSRLVGWTWDVVDIVEDDIVLNTKLKQFFKGLATNCL